VGRTLKGVAQHWSVKRDNRTPGGARHSETERRLRDREAFMERVTAF
jgi:hypothetical protein